MILTNNALISTSKSLPAWAAVGIVPGAAHIWSAENTQDAQKRAEPGLRTLPAQVFYMLFIIIDLPLCFVLRRESQTDTAYQDFTYYKYIFSSLDLIPPAGAGFEEASAGIQMCGNKVKFRPRPSKFQQRLLEFTRQLLSKLTSNSFSSVLPLLAMLNFIFLLKSKLKRDRRQVLKKGLCSVLVFPEIKCTCEKYLSAPACPL